MWPQTAHVAVIRDMAKALATRTQQLAQLPELPMRITEAEELKDLAEGITRAAAREADQKLLDTIALAVQPVRDVLREHAAAENGRLRFPEEGDLLRGSQHISAKAVAAPSMVRRMKDSLRRLVSSRR